MCGIAGILVGDGSPVDERALRAMTGALAARGPDGEGVHMARPIGLGHRRLAILDVAGGQQPLFSEDRQIVCVVNGEIYNFSALRDELVQCGHRFQTRSDSEIVVHGYEEWGADVLHRLEGMFALAVWDAPRQKLLLARDRMGEKPLYYAWVAGRHLAFASELKALRHLPGLDGRIDGTSLLRYLVYEYVPAPQTIIRGARKLEPGTYLVATPGVEPTVLRYWDLPLGSASQRTLPIDADAAARELLGELRRSVKERLISDVPLGVFLSGGLDSSTVAALAAEVRGPDLDTFSIGFEDPSFDESGEARRVARAIGSRHHEDRLSPRALLDLLPSIGRLLDEPIGDGSIVPTHLLARFVRGHVTVALGGEGGDELFSGYPTFLAERAARLLFDATPAAGRASAALGRALAALLPVSHRYFSFDFKLKQFLKGAGLRGARRHQAWLGSLLPSEALLALSPDIARQIACDPYDVIDERLAGCRASEPWDQLLYFYAKGYLGDQVLTKVDRATMAVGLEARAPLLDTRIVALACRIPPSLRMKGLEQKHLLKRAMRGLLPDETLNRQKKGFGMPIGAWLRGELRDLLEDELSAARMAHGGLFEPRAVRRLVDEHVTGKADHRKPLWTLLAFQMWHAIWLGGS